jgi:hypothetical protein
MTDRAVVSGAVFRAPAQKTTKTGRPFAVLTIRSGTGETVRWWKVIAFSESVVAEIMQLGAGQPIAVAGEIDAEVYAPNGASPRISWKIVADAVITAKRPPKEPRKAVALATPSDSSGSPPSQQRGDIDDDIPF